MKILVAEDDYSTVDLYRRILEGRGHDVTVVNRGEQCLKTYSEQLSFVRDSPAPGHESPYDCVILDYKLPDINGLQVAKEILTLNLHQRNNYCLCVCIGNSIASFRRLKSPHGSVRKTNLKSGLIDTIEDTTTFNRAEEICFILMPSRKVDSVMNSLQIQLIS